MATLYTQQSKNVRRTWILMSTFFILIIAIVIVFLKEHSSQNEILEGKEKNQVSYLEYMTPNGLSFGYRSDLTVEDMKGEHSYFTFHTDPNSLEYIASLSYTDDYSKWGFSKANTTESDLAQIYKHIGTVQYGQNVFDTWDVVMGDGYQSVLVLTNLDGQAVSIEFDTDHDQTPVDLASISFNSSSDTQLARLPLCNTGFTVQYRSNLFKIQQPNVISELQPSAELCGLIFYSASYSDFYSSGDDRLMINNSGMSCDTVALNPSIYGNPSCYSDKGFITYTKSKDDAMVDLFEDIVAGIKDY